MKKKLVMSLMIALSMTTVMPQITWANGLEVKTITAQLSENKVEGAYAKTQQKANELVQVASSVYGAASMQYALMVDGEVIISGGVGEGALEDTMYGIGSISKVYTSAAVMKLVDMGKISLDTPVYTYLPEFVMQDERYKQITTRMLLNHSSGLMGSTFEDAFLLEDIDTYAHDTLIEALSTQRLKADPGAFSVYCNDGFTLAELLIERISGMSYTEFITKHLLAPLNLKQTKTPENLETFDALATSYSPMFQGALPKEVTNVIGAGGIYATAKELCQFGQVFTGEKDILSAASIEAMAVNEAAKGVWPEVTNSSLDYGLGWDSVQLYPFNEYGVTALMKGGDTLNYHASLIVLPEYNMAVAVNASGANSMINQVIGTELLLSALEEKGDLEAIHAPKVFEVPVPVKAPQELKKYEGIYVAANQLMEISLNEEGLLSAVIVGAEYLPAQTFQYTKDGIFVSLDGSAKVSFVEALNGNTYLYVEGYATLPGLGQIASASYNAQKIEPSTLSEEERLAWEARSGKLYYVINEKYTSATYINAMPVAGILMSEKAPGYMGGYEITSPNEAKAIGQIPGGGSRDQMDIIFEEYEGVEYMKMGSNLAISEAALEEIYNGASKCTIGSKGYARWYQVGGSAAGKVMTVEIPTTGAFAVYDANGLCINHSVVSKDPKVTLPEGGKIVFMGDAGTAFKINIQ